MIEQFASYLRTYYSMAIEDVEITESPGYWRKKKACGGQGKCHHPLHGFLFNEGPIHHTIQYLDRGRDIEGRFTSQFRTWRKILEALG